MGILGKLLTSVDDRRHDRSNKSAIVFAPVGDLVQFEGFCSHIRKLGLDKEKEVDFLFICRTGIKMPEQGFSAIYAYEKIPIGTSGAFFAGQAYGYLLGYETIIVADCDAFLDSKKTFDAMLAMSRREGKAVSAPTFADESQTVPNATNPNGWGFMPRQVFEKAGFSIPYTWKGGDDFEIAFRFGRAGLRAWYNEGKVFHPMSGYTIYHRIVHKKKYYPYACGIFKALLFIADYDKPSYLKYALWYAFNYFFATLLDEAGLKKIVQSSGRMTVYDKPDMAPNPNIAIEKGSMGREYSTAGHERYFFVPKSVLLLLVFGRCSVHDEAIVLRMPRVIFALRLLLACLLLPVALAGGLASIIRWQGERRKVIFPIKPNDLDAAEGIFARLAENKSL